LRWVKIRGCNHKNNKFPKNLTHIATSGNIVVLKKIQNIVVRRNAVWLLISNQKPIINQLVINWDYTHPAKSCDMYEIRPKNRWLSNLWHLANSTNFQIVVISSGYIIRSFRLVKCFSDTNYPARANGPVNMSVHRTGVVHEQCDPAMLTCRWLCALCSKPR